MLAAALSASRSDCLRLQIVSISICQAIDVAHSCFRCSSASAARSGPTPLRNMASESDDIVLVASSCSIKLYGDPFRRPLRYDVFVFAVGVVQHQESRSSGQPVRFRPMPSHPALVVMPRPRRFPEWSRKLPHSRAITCLQHTLLYSTY